MLDIHIFVVRKYTNRIYTRTHTQTHTDTDTDTHTHTLHCIALHCSTQYAVRSTQYAERSTQYTARSTHYALHYIALHCIALRYIALHCIHTHTHTYITLHCNTLDDITFHCITLHYINTHTQIHMWRYLYMIQVVCIDNHIYIDNCCPHIDTRIYKHYMW